MNCLTRLLALGVLSLGVIGQGAALAALPSTLSTQSEVGDRDIPGNQLALELNPPVSRPLNAPQFLALCAAVSEDTQLLTSTLDSAPSWGTLRQTDIVAILDSDSQSQWVEVLPLDQPGVNQTQITGYLRSWYLGPTGPCPRSVVFNPQPTTPAPVEPGCYVSSVDTLVVRERPVSTARATGDTFKRTDAVRLVDGFPELDSSNRQWIRVITSTEDEPYQEGWVRLASLSRISSSPC